MIVPWHFDINSQTSLDRNSRNRMMCFFSIYYACHQHNNHSERWFVFISMRKINKIFQNSSSFPMRYNNTYLFVCVDVYFHNTDSCIKCVHSTDWPVVTMQVCFMWNHSFSNASTSRIGQSNGIYRNWASHSDHSMPTKPNQTKSKPSSLWTRSNALQISNESVQKPFIKMKEKKNPKQSLLCEYFIC